jgi:hypothetical protein
VQLHEAQTPNFLARHARREVNEQFSVALLGAETDVMTVLCECGSEDCDAEMTMQRRAYRKIRLKGTLFVVHTGHEHTAARVISRNGAFVIVDS